MQAAYTNAQFEKLGKKRISILLYFQQNLFSVNSI